MTSEGRLSDKRLREIRKGIEVGQMEMDEDEAFWAIRDLLDEVERLSEVERLRKESAAYALLAGRLEARLDTALEIVREVAAAANGRMLMCMCGVVGPNTRYDTPTLTIDRGPVMHQPNCVFAQARALLASADDERSGGDGG